MTSPTRTPRTLLRDGPVGEERDLADVTGVEIIGELGQGSHTVVYRVRRDGTEYAMKVLRRAGDAEDSVAFRREAALLACVDHPGLARVREVGIAHDRPYLVMDLIRGVRLTEALLDGPLAAHRIVAIGIEVGGVLTSAHGLGLVHRDVKPDNILLPSDGRARLIDFGLAIRTADEHGSAVAGTLTYTAPEQAGMLKRPVDGRADLYALGAVLYECATGRPPFSSSDVGELLRMHAMTPAPDVRTHRPDLPPALAGIIATLLAKDPDDRYQSGVGLLADLTRLAQEGDFALRGADEPVGHRRDIALTGRDAELATLTARWDRARHGQGGGIAVIDGPAGSGKSRLARELLGAARSAGHLVLRAKCEPDEPVPLAPLRSAIDDHVESVRRLAGPARALAIQRLVQAAGPAAPLLRRLSPALGEFLDGPELEEEDRHEQFVVAVATFLTALGRRAGGMVLHLDDAQWLDEATRRVLAQLSTELAGTPLLLVLGAHRDAGDDSIVAALRSDSGVAVDTTITLEPLAEAAVANLIGVLTNGLRISSQVTTDLTARTAGNPYALLEYVKAIIDAGLVRPDWGTWEFDLDGLGALDLPCTTADLVLRRLEALDEQSREVLDVAAVIGARFTVDLVGDVCRMDRRQVLDVIAEAAWQRLVDQRDGGRYAFVHNRIREALLSRIDGPALTRIHQRVVTALDAGGALDQEAVYTLAHHCQLANAGADAIFRTGYAAGRLALDNHAPAQALLFLEPAVAVAAGRPGTFAFHRTLGLAYHRVGRFRDAVRALGDALAAAPGPFERATALHLIARVYDNTWDTPGQLAAVEQGLAELGRPLPAQPALAALSVGWQVLLGLVVRFTRVGYGTVRGPQREHFRLLAGLHDAGGGASARDLRLGASGVFLLRQAFLVNRLGPGPEQVHLQSGLGYLYQSVMLGRLADRTFARAAGTAAGLGDLRLVAYVAFMRGVARYASGADDGASTRRVLSEHGRWLDVGHAIDVTDLFCWDALLTGDMADAAGWFERRGVLVAASGQVGRNAVVAAQAGHLVRRGRMGEAAAHLGRMRAASPEPLIREKVDSLIATTLAAVEQSDVGAGFDEAVAEFDRLGLAPRSLLPAQACLLVYIAYGRLEQCRIAEDDRRAERLLAARRAVRAVRAVAHRPLFRAHQSVLKATLLHLAGRNEAALARLAADEPVLRRVEAPLVAFETARLRARALRTLGIRGEADRQGRYALAVAADQGWPHQVRRIGAEFGIRSTTDSHSESYAGPNAGRPDGVHRQRLEALEQVSLAASRVLDPVALARIALDETIRILSADRAFLFLLDGEPATLVAHVGRDAAGDDLDEPTAYSATLVEQVRHSQQALVVTGTEQGVALGSQSVLLHGLRSIMVAPLQLDGRLLGVVYLDSRVAKGMFTVDDVGILTAITNHVAVALETARAVQLEVAVATARRERDLAETLRGAMSELSGILKPAEVLQRLAAIVARVLNCDHVLLARPAVGADAGPAASDDRLLRLLAATGPVIGAGGNDRPAVLVEAFGAAASWMALPLDAGDERVGTLLVASRQPAAYDRAQAGIAAALVGQGMIAYEKAELFAQVEELATIDGLTGVTNRRHFFELATHRLTLPDAPVVAMMIDIDHFKRVNDSHGHQVGDEVIRAVADRLRGLSRGEDLLGRYGGEEFAMLLAVGRKAAAGAQVSEQDVAMVAERLRAAVGDTPIETRVGPLQVTISVGATHVGAGERDVDAVLARADERLYDAKQMGRNRVSIAGGPDRSER